MKVLISGAGIGGLTSALCLQQAGHEVELFEQASELAEVGAGLQCGANALKVFKHLGLQGRIKELAVAPERVEFCDYKSGRALHVMELGQQYAADYGAPYLHVHRADLQAILVEEFERRSNTTLRLDAKVAGYSETPSGVTIRLESNARVSGDCLIAADGVRSVIRDQLLGKQEVDYTGMVAWRGVVPVEALNGSWIDTVTKNYIGPNKHAVLYYLRDRKLANFVGVVENKNSKHSSWIATAPWQELKDDFRDWHSDVQNIIDAMAERPCFRWSLVKHKPFDNWSSKRVTLLGDAAHATLPFMAAGASLAIEDARILERCLSQASDVAGALQLYQRNRMSRTAKVQAMSDQLGAMYHFKNSLMRRAAFSAIKVFGASNQAFLPNYDANTVELK